MQFSERGPHVSSRCSENPQRSHYLNLIRTSESTGREVWNIWYLFAFQRGMTQQRARTCCGRSCATSWTVICVAAVAKFDTRRL
jgi:hypothetical protein